MDPASCRVVYIDDRFPAEKWLTRDMLSSLTTNNKSNHALGPGFAELPVDLQANVSAILGVFNQGEFCLLRQASRVNGRFQFSCVKAGDHFLQS